MPEGRGKVGRGRNWWKEEEWRLVVGVRRRWKEVGCGSGKLVEGCWLCWLVVVGGCGGDGSDDWWWMRG